MSIKAGRLERSRRTALPRSETPGEVNLMVITITKVEEIQATRVHLTENEAA